MKFQLYPWQEECLNLWCANHFNGIAGVVTGAGKTVLALAGISRLEKGLHKPLRIKIIVPTTSLMHQWAGAMTDFSYGSDNFSISREDIGFYCGTHKEHTCRKYMIYVINSARYSLARHIIDDVNHGFSVLLIADECHHYASTENKKIFDFIPYIKNLPDAYFSLGLSATPKARDYASVLIPCLGKEIYRYGFLDAARKKSISRSAIFQTAITFNPNENAEYTDLSGRLNTAMNRLTSHYPHLRNLDRTQFFLVLNQIAGSCASACAALANTVLALSYRRKALVYNAAARIPCACKLVELLDPLTRIIIFGERIEQADALYSRLSKCFHNQVGRYHSKMDKQTRKNILEQFRNGEIRILISCRALDEGFDIPGASVGIVLSSSSVERQRVQRLGRILRHQKGKDISCLYYLYLDNSVEESAFFQDAAHGSRICSLSYSSLENRFSHWDYEAAAALILNRIKAAEPEQRIWEEARKCLMKGLIRPDWLLDEQEIRGKIAEAETNAEANYWICMEQVSKACQV